MSGLPGKMLTMELIMRRIYDETPVAIRTTVTNSTSIDIDASDDSIAIGDRDTGDLLKINNDGSINVNAVNSDNGKIYFNEITSVTSGVQTLILSKLITIDSYLLLVSVSGNNIAEYELKLNGNTIDKCYTNFGAPLNADLKFSNIKLIPTDVLEVFVRHDRPYLGKFSGKFLIEE